MAYQREIEKLEARFQEKPEQWFAALADAYRKNGDLDLALDLLQQWIAQRPNYTSGHIVLGRVLVDRGEDAAAAPAFERVLELDGENIIAVKSLSEIAERQGDLAGAEGWLHRLIEIDPMNDEARAQLETLGAQRGAAGQAPEMAGAPDAAGPEAGAPAVAAEIPSVVAPEPLEPPAAAVPDAPGGFTPDDAFTVERASVQGGEATLGFESGAGEPAADAGGLGAGFPVETTPEEVLPDPAAAADPEPGLVLGAGSEPHGDSSLADKTPTAPMAPALFDASGLDVADVSEPPPGEATTREIPGLDVLGPGEDLAGQEPAGDGGIVAGDLETTEQEYEAVVRDSATLPAIEGLEPTSELWGPDVGGGDAGEPSALPAAPHEAVASGAAADVTEPPPPPPPPPPAAEDDYDDDGDSGPDLPLIMPDELGPEEPGEREPEPVMTETMAELYARQGLWVEARDIYRQLAAARPDEPALASRLAELEEQVRSGRRAAAPPSSAPGHYSVARTGGQSAMTFLQNLLKAEGPSRPAPAAPPEAPADEAAAATPLDEAFGEDEAPMPAQGAPTAPAGDDVSLAAVFGEEPPASDAPAPPRAPPSAGAEEPPAADFSFDDFFGAPKASPPEEAAPEAPPSDDGGTDEEDFQAWLKGLKT